MSALRWLERVVAAEPGRPETLGADHPMRNVTRQIAFEPGGWTRERKAKVAELFDGLAPDWDARIGASESTTPIRDALTRGGSLAGPCVELGAGTGRATTVLVDTFGPTVALDLSGEMLARFREPRAQRVRGDSAFLPVRSRSVGLLVLVNMFLFPAEVDRVLQPDGALLWINTLGDATPIHLPPADVVGALPGAWVGVGSDAGWGLWTVVRRAA